MRVELKIEAVTGHEHYPLLDLSEMLEAICQDLEQLTAEQDVDAVNHLDPDGVHVTTDDGEAKATVTVRKDQYD
jgi:hypothetical protein